MNIEIDQKTVDSAVEELVKSGVAEAIQGYGVRDAVKASLSEAFENGNLAKSIQEGIANVNTDHISQAIALQLQRTSTHMVSELLGEAVSKIVCDLRGLLTYDNDDKAERRRVAEEMKVSIRGARHDA